MPKKMRASSAKFDRKANAIPLTMPTTVRTHRVLIGLVTQTTSNAGRTDAVRTKTKSSVRLLEIGLNKGEARNALARAVFLCRLGEIRDRSFEQQRYRASGLTLVTAAIVLWNTVYIERAIDASARNHQVVDAELLKYLSPLGWEHVNLTGDYQWRGKRLAQGRFRPLRIQNPA
jgi:hypothetical protein